MQFNFEQIGKSLERAEPRLFAIEPLAAYALVGLLQLALRHPQLKAERGPSYEAGVHLIEQLQQWLEEIDPTVAQSLKAGWDESLDMSPEDFRQFSQTNDLPQRNYSQLRQDIQEEVVLNSIALGIACDLLARNLGGNRASWSKHVSVQASSVVDRMDKETIKQSLAQIDFARDFQQ